MHTFFCACDTLGCGFWTYLATQNDNFWAFYAFGACMGVWVVLEIVSMYFSAKYERQSSFGSLFQDPVTMRQAGLHDLVQTVMWMAVIASVIHFMGGFEDAALFKLYFWTNLIVALGPCWFWKRRGIKAGHVGAGVAIQVMILITIVITWIPAPFGMWCAVSNYCWTPTCIIAGIMTTRFAIYNLVYQIKPPKKPVVVEGKKPLP